MNARRAKRHHVVPEFLLRRFTERAAEKKSLVWRLNKRTGQPRRANPKNEAVIGRYYEFEPEATAQLEEGTPQPEEVLGQIEGYAADSMRTLSEAGSTISDEQRLLLALFIVLMRNRTPLGRQWLKEVDEMTHELEIRMRLESPEAYQEHPAVAASEMTPEEAEAARIELLRDLDEGRIVIESTPNRELAAMFLNVDKTSVAIAELATWATLRASRGSEFVLGDNGLAMIDPTPRHAGSGLGFLSSPNAETTLPLDPKTCPRITPGEERWKQEDVSAAVVDDINLRSYSWAQECIYAATQEAVRTRAQAKRMKQRVAEVAPRPGKIWIGEEQPDGTVRFDALRPRRR